MLKQGIKSIFLVRNLSLFGKFSCFRSTRQGISKSRITRTFHGEKNQLLEQQNQEYLNPSLNDCEELTELKKYFEEVEQEVQENEHDEEEFLFEGENGLSNIEMNEGDESDFSEELEKVIHSSENGHLVDSSKKKLSVKGTKASRSSSKPDSKKKTHSDADKNGNMNLHMNKSDQPTFMEKRFGRNISSDVQTRQIDLQQFVLKSLQMLSIKEIQHFIQIIEYFKSKLTNHSFKNSQNSHEDFFLKQIFKLFQNNNLDNAEELMELFLKCDLIDLNLNLFLNNVADFENTQEVKSKFRQFDAFTKQNQPHGGHFLLNELAEKYDNLEYQRESSLSYDIDEEDQLEETQKETGEKNRKNQLQQQQQQKQQQISKLFDGEIKVNSHSNNGQSQEKERLLFAKVARYEDQVFEQFRTHKNIQNLYTKNQEFSKEIESDQFVKAENDLNDNWSSSLLEDDIFFEGTNKRGSISKNNHSNCEDMSIISNENTINTTRLLDNFVLEPSQFSQQKIHQIQQRFENQFSHNNLTNNSSQKLHIPNPFQSASLSQQPYPSEASSSSLHNSIKLLEKDVSELWNLESERSAISTKKINKLHNNKMALKANYERDIQQNDEIIILNQEEPLIPKKFETTNWVYLFKLPYNLNEVQNYPQFVKNFIESCFGEIEEAHFFNYMDFFEIQKTKDRSQNSNLSPEQEVKLRGQLQEQFMQQNQISKKVVNNGQTIINRTDQQNQNLSATQTTNNTPQSSSDIPRSKPSSAVSSTSNLNNLTDEELLEKIYINSKINPDFCSRALKRTEKILEKIESKKEQKYNRSYAMLKFKSKESKDKCLSSDIRLFGIQNINQTFYSDDADYKKSLIISKIPWGVSLQYLITKLNEQLKFHGIKHIKISLENVNLKKIVTKYFLLVKFNSFEDTLEVMKAFKDKDFIIETSKLSCNHCYGSLKLGPKGYYEVTDMVMGKDIDLLERVNERKVFEIWNIYKEKSGFVNQRKNEENGLENNNNNYNIELKEEELEDYNETIDQDTLAQQVIAGSDVSHQQHHQHASTFGQGFSKSSVFSQMKSITSEATVSKSQNNQETQENHKQEGSNANDTDDKQRKNE